MVYFKKCDQIHTVELVVKITDNDKFNEIFPDIENVSKVQPFWTYHDRKGVIKIDLGMDIVDFLNKLIRVDQTFDYTIKDLINLRYNGKHLISVYFDFFKQFGELFIYITYYLNNEEFINVYNERDFILSTQFLYKNSKTNNIILNYCCTDDHLENRFFVTDYLKKFMNNDNSITPELVVLHHDKLNINTDFLLFKILFDFNNVQYYNVRQIIF